MGMTRRSILLILFKLFDAALLVGSFLVASLPRLREASAISLTQFLAMRISVRNFVLFATLVLLWHALFCFLELYESKRLWGQHTEAVDVLEATSLATVALFVVGSFFIPSITDPQFLGLFWFVSTATVLVSRHVLRFMLKQIRKRGRNTIQMLIVGTNLRALMFAKELESQSELGYRILGFVDKKWPGMDEFRKSGFAFAVRFPRICLPYCAPTWWMKSSSRCRSAHAISKPPELWRSVRSKASSPIASPICSISS